MFDIIIIGFLSYRNGVRAKTKGQNPILWGLATFVAYVITMMIGIMVVIANFCKDTINLAQFSSLDIKSREVARQQLIQVFQANPLHMLTIELFGVGGYLLVRYILDRKPGKKETEVHWMDKMGQGQE
jgi:hypothetical protein